MKKPIHSESENALAKALFGKKPANQLKSKIMNVLANLALEEQFDWQNPPLINQYSDSAIWQKAVAEVNAPNEFENLYSKVLKKSDKAIWCLVWVKNNVPEEDHDDLKENILILEGACYFTSSRGTMAYQEGDFIDVPEGKHSLVVTSDIPLKFVLYRENRAA
jgi:hypothetical protein